MRCKNMALMTIIIMVKSSNETIDAFASAIQYHFQLTYQVLIPSISFHLIQPHYTCICIYTYSPAFSFSPFDSLCLSERFALYFWFYYGLCLGCFVAYLRISIICKSTFIVQCSVLIESILRSTRANGIHK